MPLYDLILSGFVYLISGIIFFCSGSIAEPDSRLLPMIVTIVLIILSTINLVWALAFKKRQEYDFSGTPKVMLVLFILTAYICLIYLFGFYICTPFFIFAVMLVLGQKNKKVLALVPIITTVLIAVLFSFIFTIPAPTGNLYNVLGFIGL